MSDLLVIIERIGLDTLRLTMPGEKAQAFAQTVAQFHPMDDFISIELADRTDLIRRSTIARVCVTEDLGGDPRGIPLGRVGKGVW